MKNLTLQKSPISELEKRSAKLLMERMGLSKKEFHEISDKYGVDASRMIELMQLSKYSFIISDPAPQKCTPCITSQEQLQFARQVPLRMC